MKVTGPANCAASATATEAPCAAALLFTLIVAMGAGLLCALLHATRPAAITAIITLFRITCLLSNLNLKGAGPGRQCKTKPGPTLRAGVSRLHWSSKTASTAPATMQIIQQNSLQREHVGDEILDLLRCEQLAIFA